MSDTEDIILKLFTTIPKFRLFILILPFTFYLLPSNLPCLHFIKELKSISGKFESAAPDKTLAEFMSYIFATKISATYT
jgi:hypothetical protein